MLLADILSTLVSWSVKLPGLGVRTWSHWWPFQCTMRVLFGMMSPGELDWVAYSPTAQMSVAETAVTLLRMLLPAPGLGLATCAHAVPFQCSMRVRKSPLAAV